MFYIYYITQCIYLSFINCKMCFTLIEARREYSLAIDGVCDAMSCDYDFQSLTMGKFHYYTCVFV